MSYVVEIFHVCCSANGTGFTKLWAPKLPGAAVYASARLYADGTRGSPLGFTGDLGRVLHEMGRNCARRIRLHPANPLRSRVPVCFVRCVVIHSALVQLLETPFDRERFHFIVCEAS